MEKRISGTTAVKRMIALGADGQKAICFVNKVKRNRKAWELFEELALLEIRQGEKRLSAKALYERMRKILARESLANGESYVLSNTWHSYMARFFAAKYPEYQTYFEFRNCNTGRAA
jgi:hypothetical protein